MLHGSQVIYMHLGNITLQLAKFSHYLAIDTQKLYKLINNCISISILFINVFSVAFAYAIISKRE